MHFEILTLVNSCTIKNNVNLSPKCRYTLQYTYPYAYYMESGPRKKLVSSTAFYCRILRKTLIFVHPGSFPLPPVSPEVLRLKPVWEGFS